ncbi:MAG: hypothetical protein J6A75_01465 [Lachnospiraceae bacterium]|nr:hypothetical protein [Lachnospiraceae bacterium]
MSRTEDYLDSLLNSVSSGRTGMSESRSHRRMGMESIEDFENQITEVDMEAFEQQLNDADMESFVRDFEIEVDNTENEVIDAGDEDHFFDDLDGIIKKAREKADAKMQRESASDEMDADDWTDADGASEELLSIDGEESAQKETPEVTDDTKELIDMLADLSGDAELSDIGKKLQNGEFDMESDEGASIELSELEDDEAKEEKPKKKEGFLKRLKKKLSDNSEEGEEEETVLAESEDLDGDEYANMSEEDMEILKELQAAESAGDESTESAADKKKKKKQEKQEKKAQKKQEKKEKKALKAQKAKEAKSEKVKKPKKPKEVDLSPPLPRKPVMLICLMGISVLALILLCSNHVGYTMSLSEAKTAYREQDYVKAYQELSGITIKENDAAFYEKVFLLAKVQEEYRSGEVLFVTGEYTKSLDSYICALGRYDANYQDATTCGVQMEYDVLAEQIADRMKEKFGITAEEARELYGLYDRTEYTCRVYDIVKGLGLIAAEE